MTYAVHVSLAPTWFDPAETSGMITPFLVLYALHDALVKPMPGQSAAPSLAESWTAAPDGLSYEFVLRKGVTFHNGEPVTADDVKFSFERYRGTAAAQLKSRVAGVDVVDSQRVPLPPEGAVARLHGVLRHAATGAGWIVPRKYLEKVGDEGFKKAPIGAGPYKFVSFNPGVELVLEAHAAYWRKTPSVKRLVLRVVPDESTRLAMLKNGEVDVAYSIRGALAEELRRSPGLTLKATYLQGTYWVLFADQWDPKSPWADRRVRLAASHSMNRKA
jgi:peptide/nickel transport system substrate-binding protein